MTTRNRGTDYGGATHGPFIYNYYHGGALNSNVLTESFTDVHTKSITDDLTPEYFSKVRRRQFLQINPVSIVEVKRKLLQPHAGTVTEIITPANYYTGSFLWFEGCNLPSPSVAPDESEMDAVVIKALSQAKQPDWDILTFLGELHHTVDLLRQTITRFGNLGRWIAKKARRKEVRRAKKQKRPYDPQKALVLFSSLWLEARYAWRPMVYDIRSALKALNHHRKNALSRKSAMHEEPVDLVVTAAADYSSIRVDRTKTLKGSIRYRSVVFYKDEMGPIGANPVITAWQLTRFSFVIDWFVDVSGWLQAVSPREGFTNLGVSVSAAVDVVETDVQQYGPGSGGAFTVSVSDRKVETHIRTYERRKYTGIPLPSFDVRLNPLKIVDLAFLAFQARADISKILKL